MDDSFLKEYLIEIKDGVKRIEKNTKQLENRVGSIEKWRVKVAVYISIISVGPATGLKHVWAYLTT